VRFGQFFRRFTVVFRMSAQATDSIDKLILAALESNARVPLAALAKKVGRSRTAVQARIQRLERTGVIQGYRAVTTESYGAVETFIIVYLRERLSPHGVLKTLSGVPEVIGIYRVTGDADLIVTLGPVTRKRLQDICEPLWERPDVRTTETIMVLKSYKG
jgi:Lrp/AsnC family transcriptional regulator, leucine-responsive regulatory protein